MCSSSFAVVVAFALSEKFSTSHSSAREGSRPNLGLRCGCGWCGHKSNYASRLLQLRIESLIQRCVSLFGCCRACEEPISYLYVEESGRQRLSYSCILMKICVYLVNNNEIRIFDLINMLAEIFHRACKSQNIVKDCIKNVILIDFENSILLRYQN